MSKKPKVKEIIDNGVIDIGIAQEKRAIELAALIDTSVGSLVATLAEHKREYVGGPFVVMDKVLRFLAGSGYDLSSLPEPHTKTGNNPAYYRKKVESAKGVRYTEVYFYDELALKLPSVRAMVARIDVVKRSLAKDKSSVKTDDIPTDLYNLPIHTREAEIKRLEQEKTVAKSNVSNAFELYHQIEAFDELDTVKVVMSFEVGADGKLCNGEDGRPYRVEKIASPIKVQSTLEGREDLDFGRYSIASFLRFDVAKAQEAVGGATFAALENTLAKTAAAGIPSSQVAVNTLQTFVTRMNDISEYLHRTLEASTKADWEALKKLAGKGDQEGNNFLYNISFLVANLRPIADDPRNQVTFQRLVDERDEKAKKAA